MAIFHQLDIDDGCAVSAAALIQSQLDDYMHAALCSIQSHRGSFRDDVGSQRLQLQRLDVADAIRHAG